MEIDDKVFFTPGMVVTLKQDIPNKPTMLVVRKKTLTIKSESDKVLLGIVCRWFTKDGKLEEAIFSTKDLIQL